MNRQLHSSTFSILTILACLLAAFTTVTWAQESFDEVKALIEINATDGDAGFHVLMDGDAWWSVRMVDPDGNKIFDEKAKGSLREQGLTENFFESAEPLCEFDPEEPEEEVVSLAEFLARFPAGDYELSGVNNEGEKLEDSVELTYNIPAAPDISATEDSVQNIASAVVSWAAGTDLGEKCHDQDLVDMGIISDPEFVEVVGWELVVEPADDEAADPKRVYSVQLAPGQTSVTVPQEFLQLYFDQGFTTMKFEVGAIEASANQVFSEGEFEITD